MEINLELPEKLEFLFKKSRCLECNTQFSEKYTLECDNCGSSNIIPIRYKVAKGGRGSAKSWSFGAAAIVLTMQSEILFVCAREIQKSIKESVHRLLKGTIKRMGLMDSFDITESSIKCVHTGSEFIFIGLAHNPDAVKSLEGADYCWVEEAHNVSEESWDILTPTVRKETKDENGNVIEQSEIWATYNPKFEDDATHERFATNPTEDMIVVTVNYTDNPWFPNVLRKEMEHDKKHNFTLYQHKWLGMPKGGGGRVWPEYDPEVHVKEFDYKELSKTANCYMAMDPHQHYYPACVWVAVFPMNERRNWPEDFHFHIYNEWPTFDDLGAYYHKERKNKPFTGTMLDISKEIYAKDGTEYGLKVRSRSIDTRFAKGVGGWSTSTQGMVELYAKPENGGIVFEMPPEKTIDSQRDLIHSRMSYNKHAPISEFNQPQFSIAPHCLNMKMSLNSHRMTEPDPHKRTEKQSEKFKDFSDAMRIGFANIVDYQDPNPQPRRSRVGSSRSWAG